MTLLKESTLYRKSYGAWAGFPSGHAPDHSRCCEEIRGNERWPRYYQCSRPCGHGPDGAYCKQHDPAVAKARSDAANARSKEKWNNERYGVHGRTFFNALLKISEGHNDARGLAQEVIENFKKGEYR